VAILFSALIQRVASAPPHPLSVSEDSTIILRINVPRAIQARRMIPNKGIVAITVSSQRPTARSDACACVSRRYVKPYGSFTWLVSIQYAATADHALRPDFFW
jgi:hypothetical protein